ncbi:MAG: radical SAM protein [Candidatus Aminicenantales bacterium]
MTAQKSYVRIGRASDALSRLGKTASLLRLDVELTERCNNNCVHCYINLPEGDREARQRELSALAIRRVLGEAADLGCLTVRFTGGEPLIRPDFEEIYLAARKLGMGVILFTNARLITPRLVSLFETVPPMHQIEVSVYGMMRDSYEAVSRAKGSFDEAWKGIRLLEEKKIPFVAKGVLLSSDAEESIAFDQWASSIPGADGPPSRTVIIDLHCRRDLKKSRSIGQLRIAPQELARLMTANPENRRDLLNFAERSRNVPGDGLFTCGAGLRTASLDAYGNLHPCIMLHDPGTGYDLLNGSLKEAMETFFPRLRTQKASRPEYLARCARCSIKSLCEQCPARSWIESGEMDSPVAYYCDVAHALAGELGLLKPGEKGWEVPLTKQAPGPINRAGEGDLPGSPGADCH